MAYLDMNTTQMAQEIESRINYDDIKIGGIDEKSIIFFSSTSGTKIIIRIESDITKRVKDVIKQNINKSDFMTFTSKTGETKIIIIDESKEQKAIDYGMDSFSRKKIRIDSDIFYTEWKKDQ